VTEDAKTRLWRRLLAGWNAIAARFGAVQTLVILGLFYIVLIGPAALGRLLGRGDPLQKRRLGAAASAWRDADTAGADLERARQTS
jgi:hypothetical protein